MAFNISGCPIGPKHGISKSQKSDGFGTNPTFTWDFSGIFCFLLLDNGIQAKLQADIFKKRAHAQASSLEMWMWRCGIWMSMQMQMRKINGLMERMM